MGGRPYYSGIKVAKDFAKALLWFKKSADQGDDLGQVCLGRMYAQGDGVTQDYVIAHMWYGLSAAQGNKVAAERLNKLELKMTANQISKARDLAAKWKPVKAELGNRK